MPDENYLEQLCLNISILCAVQSINLIRLSVHEYPSASMSDRQHRLLRRIFGQAHANEQAIEIISTITGDNGRTRVRSLSRYGASAVIEELIDGTKDITSRGRTVILGIQSLVEAFPVFEERDAYIEGLATDLRNLRTAHHGRARHARGYNHERERARELLRRGTDQYRRELCPSPPGWEEPRLMSLPSPQPTRKRAHNKASSKVRA